MNLYFVLLYFCFKETKLLNSPLLLQESPKKNARVKKSSILKWRNEVVLIQREKNLSIMIHLIGCKNDTNQIQRNINQKTFVPIKK